MADKLLIALLTNNDDDVYCFRLELIQSIMAAGYRMLISCPNGPKFEVMEEIGLRKNQEFIYDDPPIDRRGTSVIKDGKLMIHYRSLFKKYRPAVVLTYTAKPNVYASLVAHQLHIPVINNVTGLGSVVNEIDTNHVANIPLPLLKNQQIQKKINDLILDANKKRYDAYLLEQQAIKMVNDKVIYAS